MLGKDNAKHYKPIAELPHNRPSSLPPDAEALVEMFRILKPDGKLVVTVPFGKFVDYGWFIHYDLQAVSTFFQAIPSAKIHREYFKYMEAGWMPCTAAALVDTSYRDRGAPAAGLACFEITKPA
jgi:O-antigen chain-terminating methyltransferase